MCSLGGYQPDAGYVYIPSILVIAPHGLQLELSLRRNVTVSAEIIPSRDNKAADSWYPPNNMHTSYTVYGIPTVYLQVYVYIVYTCIHTVHSYNISDATVARKSRIKIVLLKKKQTLQTTFITTYIYVYIMSPTSPNNSFAD